MFGEYAIYCDQKLVALICDNQLFVEAPPYPGAKPSFLIQEKISDSAWLTKLIKITADELPLPKAKKKNAKKKMKKK